MPIRRVGTTQDIALTSVFLASYAWALACTCSRTANECLLFIGELARTSTATLWLSTVAFGLAPALSLRKIRFASLLVKLNRKVAPPALRAPAQSFDLLGGPLAPPSCHLCNKRRVVRTAHLSCMASTSTTVAKRSAARRRCALVCVATQFEECFDDCFLMMATLSLPFCSSVDSVPVLLTAVCCCVRCERVAARHGVVQQGSAQRRDAAPRSDCAVALEGE